MNQTKRKMHINKLKTLIFTSHIFINKPSWTYDVLYVSIFYTHNFMTIQIIYLYIFKQIILIIFFIVIDVALKKNKNNRKK